MAQAAGWSWRVDGLSHCSPGVAVRGSQGPWSKRDGLLTPAHLSGPWPGPIRLVGFNVQYGPGATAVPGAWVEMPQASQRGPAERKILPTGNDPRMIPCGQQFRLNITDDDIEAWLDDQGIAENLTLRVSMRWFAHGLRDHGMRLSESGTGYPIIESTGAVNPAEASAWAARGVTTQAQASGIGANLLRYGTLEAV